VQPHQISMRRDSNRAIATDAEGYELRVGDNMKENDGEVSQNLSFRVASTFSHCPCSVGKAAFFTCTNPSLRFCTTVRL
jgi:transcription elongation factor